MSPALQSSVWRRYPQISVPAGRTLLVEGERSASMLILVEGAARVDVDDVTVARIDEPGSVIGELAGLLGIPRTATVTAETDVTCRRVDDVAELFRTDPEAGLDIARMLAHRLHLLDAYLADIRRQYADRSDHLGMVDSVLASLAAAVPVEVEPGSDREREPNQ